MADSEFPKTLVRGDSTIVVDTASDEVAAKFNGFRVDEKAKPAVDDEPFNWTDAS